MAESVLVNRKKFISSLDNKLVEPLNALSKKTRVPKSRLLDEAIEEANAAAYNWISLELDEDDCQLPPVSDEDDLDLKEGDIVRNISVNIRFYEGWDE